MRMMASKLHSSTILQLLLITCYTKVLHPRTWEQTWLQSKKFKLMSQLAIELMSIH